MKISWAGTALLLAVLFTMVPFPARADEGILEWSPVDKPGLRGDIVVSPSEVSDIAVGSRGIIYAVDSSANTSKTSKIYQSVNAGASWEDITSRLTQAGAGLPAVKVALAPDTTGIVAVVTDNGSGVYLSTDGGSSWANTAVPGTLAGKIQAMAISRQYIEDGQPLREVAIGTASWGDNTTTGQVWVFQMGQQRVSSWRDQGLSVDQVHPGGEVAALAYSPNFPRDNTIVVVAATGNDTAGGYQNRTWLCLGERDTEEGTTSWSAFSGYPVEVATSSSPSAGDDTGASISASLALPSDYSGSDDTLRQLFVSYDRSPDASDDVYRFDDTAVYRLDANSGAAISLSSLAYYGTTTSGELLAGDTNAATATAVQVRRTSNPFSLTPTWQLASTPPSGPGHAILSWSPQGDSVYCGTGQIPGVALDESAFSQSSDDGDNWQQLSLIDTTLELSDLAAAPDSSTLFVATGNPLGPEGIWRSARTTSGIGAYWSRQWTMNTATNRVILRLSPDYASDYTLYAAEAGGTLMAVSHDRGNSWKMRHATDDVVDIVVEDENTLYAALAGGYVRKSTNGAFTWGDPVFTGIPDINMLALAGKGTLVVGGRNGEIAYSRDGGASFTRINEVIGSGDVQVVADINYPENGLIYAATDAADGGTWRHTTGSSGSWEQIDASITKLGTGQCIGGLAMGAAGTLYALRLEAAGGNQGGMTRSLDPASPHLSDIEFDASNAALPAGTRFDATLLFPSSLLHLPQLKLSGSDGQNDLWALDTAHDLIYRFQDSLATQAPVQLAPADGFQNPANSANGRSGDTAFTWQSPSEGVTSYEVGIYADDNATSPMEICPVTSTSDTPVVLMGPYQTAAHQFLKYAPGTTYYWRVRATLPLRSPWSEIRRFSTEPLPAPVPQLLAPGNGATGVSPMPSFSWAPAAGTSAYQFLLADNASLEAPLVDVEVDGSGYTLDKELDFGQTYFWEVRAAAPVAGDWSALANFTVEEKPVAPPAPVEVREAPPPSITMPAPAPPLNVVLPPSPPAPVRVVPAYILALIIIGGILVLVVVAMIIRTG